MADFYTISQEGMVETEACVPYRAFDLIEFYKKVKEDKRFAEITGVEFDTDGHMVVFHVLLTKEGADRWKSK